MSKNTESLLGILVIFIIITPMLYLLIKISGVNLSTMFKEIFKTLTSKD